MSNEAKTAWTQFWDMHSGGGQKEQWARIYIEAPEDVEKWGGRSYQPYMTLDEYRNDPEVLIIPAAEITEAERKGSVPAQGYQWVG